MPILYGNVTGIRIGKCWAAVAENKGLHLPCCYKNGKFRIVSEDGTALRCIGDGSRYILHVRPNCSIMWQDYTIGDPIPAKAAQVSVWKDFSPLYMVAAKFGLLKIGYYSPAAKRIFILARTPRNPSNVQILIINWLLSLCLWLFLMRTVTSHDIVSLPALNNLTPICHRKVSRQKHICRDGYKCKIF